MKCKICFCVCYSFLDIILNFALILFKAGNHVVLMVGFTEFCVSIRTKHVRK